MCYHCATNPSIHHCCCHVATVSSPLSHHGVTFTVMSSWFHLRHCIVAVLLLPSWCHLHICHGFIVAVVVSPSCRSWFRCCRRGVAFVVALSRFHCRHSVAFIVAL